MQVAFLFFADCPSHAPTLARLNAVMDELQLNGWPIDIVEVTTEEQATCEQFVGSPTIRINGEDIVSPNHTQYGLMCRVYQLEDGRYSPMPSVNMIRKALQKAQKQITEK
jgi:hypothetical protein